MKKRLIILKKDLEDKVLENFSLKIILPNYMLNLKRKKLLFWAKMMLFWPKLQPVMQLDKLLIESKEISRLINQELGILKKLFLKELIFLRLEALILKLMSWQNKVHQADQKDSKIYPKTKKQRLNLSNYLDSSKDSIIRME